MTVSQGVGIELLSYQVDSSRSPDIECLLDNATVTLDDLVLNNSSTKPGSNGLTPEWRVLHQFDLTEEEHNITCSVQHASADQPFYLMSFNIYRGNNELLLEGDITTVRVSFTPCPVKT